MIGKKLTNKKALVLVCLLGMLFGMTGCSGRKTVLLESEDLVRAEGQTEDVCCKKNLMQRHLSKINNYSL